MKPEKKKRNFQNSKIGLKSEILLKKSFFVSKILTKNIYTIPVCKRLKIVFPLYEIESTLRSKSVLILLEFLEQISGIRAMLKRAKIIVGDGLWVQGEVNLTGFSLMKFLVFWNEYCLSHPLLKLSRKKPFLRCISKSTIRMIFPDIEFLFDSFSKRVLPSNKFYWLELNFYFEKNAQLQKSTNLNFYIQYFFSKNLTEWRNL